MLSLNSEAPHGAGSAQVRWLRAQLRAPGTCRLAFWHEPRYNAGRHEDAPDLAPLWDALRGHARLVVNGHDHNMQRFRADRRHHPVRLGRRAGTSATRCAATAAWPSATTATSARCASSWRPGRARMAFVSAGGRILDLSTVRCAPPTANEVSGHGKPASAATLDTRAGVVDEVPVRR